MNLTVVIRHNLSRLGRAFSLAIASEFCGICGSRGSGIAKPLRLLPAIPHLVGAILLLSFALLIPALAQPIPETLQSLLKKGVASFNTGQYAQAVDIFDALEEQFGREPEFTEAHLQQILLPIRGYAQLRAGRPQEAAVIYEKFLEQFPNQGKKTAFVLFSLARAYHDSGAPRKGIDVYERFETAFPQSPEAYLALLSRAELLFEIEEDTKGIALLNKFYVSQAPSSLRMQARLRALQQSLNSDNMEMAKEILLNTPWSFTTIPELAGLAFSALQVGDYLLNIQSFANAIRAYRLVPPKDTLVQAQQARLREIQGKLYQRATSARGPRDTIWADYYRKFIGRIQAQLKELEEAEDYTPTCRLRYGQAMLLAGRPHEAWLIFETLALDHALDHTIRAQAHYRWILSAQALESWDEVLIIARSFLQRYPHSPLAPQAFFLIAQAYEKKREYKEAIALLSELIEKFPNHVLFPRWIFTRGYYALLNEVYDMARLDFQRYHDSWPDGPLIINAQFWHALSWFFEKNYTSALDELNTLVQSATDHPLVPEINYRRAATLYAMRDYGFALEAIDAFLKNYPGHPRIFEAEVLRGDILMGKGELLKAASAFARITPEALNLFPYAIFQTGKIYRALQDYDGMIAHFQNYVERDDLPARPKVSEALYWIGWAYNQQGRMADAFPIFVETLDTYGNLPEASEILLVLRALYDLHRRYGDGDLTTLHTDHTILASSNFESWLQETRQSALGHGELTYYSRLSLFLAERYEKQKRQDEANTILLEIVQQTPLEALDAEGLGRAGLVLEKFDFPSASLYFESLLERFPHTPARAMAYYGLARIHFEAGRYKEALPWLKRFSGETPLHSLVPEVSLLEGETWLSLSQPEEAIAIYKELLRLKSARGRAHAKALQGLARAYLLLENPDKAIAYYQRIYTLYRAYSDIVAEAYLQSARLFEQIGDLQAAYNTLEELLHAHDLNEFQAYAQARAEKALLEPLLSPKASQTEEEIITP